MTEQFNRFQAIFTAFSRRSLAYPLMLVVGLLLFLPNLGNHCLWDVDEAHNAECAREMWEANEWIVPTFNYSLRTDKPVLLYWCLSASYSLGGVNEWSARFPSLFAGLLSMLLCYEIGRRLFDGVTGLLAACILGSSFMFCISSHAVTPDALLICSVQAIFFTFLKAYDNRQPRWLLLSGLAAGLAVLAKGPVGLVLPSAVILLFLLWQRDLHFLGTRRTLQAAALFLAVSLPWYITVGVMTRWEFIQGFFLKHNLDRFNAPMEGHVGPWYYHLLVLLAAFAPWSIFLGPTLWHAARPSLYASDTKPWAYRFLALWILVWLSVFTLAATKLPNYILPIYPPLALCTSRFLVRWIRGDFTLPAWVWRTSLACLVLVAFVLTGGLAAVSGWLPLPQLQGRVLPEIAYILPVALIPLITVLFIWRRWHQHRWQAGVTTLVLGNILLTASLAACGPTLVDEERAIRPLAEALDQIAGNSDFRIGLHPAYYRPSFVFYARREVVRCTNREQALELLQSPLPTYLLMPASEWPQIAEQLGNRCTLVDKHNDITLGQEVLLLGNHAANTANRTASNHRTQSD